MYNHNHKHMVRHLVLPNLLHLVICMYFNQGRHHIEFFPGWNEIDLRSVQWHVLHKALRLHTMFTTHNIKNWSLCLLKSWFVCWTVGILLNNSTIHWTHCTNPQPRFHCCQKLNMALPWLRSIVANEASWGEKFTSPVLTAPNYVPGRIWCDKMCLANISHYYSCNFIKLDALGAECRRV